MPVIPQISIVWTTSPREIFVASPVTDVVAQDLADTLRFHEAKLENHHWQWPGMPAGALGYLCKLAGKDNLGAAGFAGIVVTLRNAVIEFEARGSPTVCSFSQGSLVAVGTDLSTPLFPIKYSTNVMPVIIQDRTGAMIAGAGPIQLAPVVVEGPLQVTIDEHALETSIVEDPIEARVDATVIEAVVDTSDIAADIGDDELRVELEDSP